MSAMVHFAMVVVLRATSCNGGPCISVSTDPTNNQIVITANQNTPGTTTVVKPTPKPRPKPSVAATPRPKPKPTTWIPWAPKPAPKYTYKPRPVVKKKKSVVAAVTTAAVNLSDQITQLLPGNHLLYQPVAGAVAQVPVYFWSDSQNIFQVATSILGIGVNVSLSPMFTWNFGDGSSMTTSTPGGAYPDKTITHTYTRPGNYTATLSISWAGDWLAQGVLSPITGSAIVQSMSSQIVVGPAPTSFIG